MAEQRLISSDGHVTEPPDLWTTRLPPEFRDRAPRLVQEEDGDWWYCEDRRIAGLSGFDLGWRFEGREILHTARFEDVVLGGYIPEEHVKDMDSEGLYGDVLYPTTGGSPLFETRDSQLLSAIFRTYNDWLAEFCSACPSRLKGIAAMNLDEIEEGVEELPRARRLGLVGGLISVYPPQEWPYSRSEYDRLWATAQDLEMPLSLHIGTMRPGPGDDFQQRQASTAFRANRDYWVRMSLAQMIYAGVFERYPKLKVGTVEHELGWIPFFLERLDYTYTQRNRRSDWIPFENNMLPSDFFRRNAFCSFQQDPLAIQHRDIIGVDTLMWGWDYPHAESTFPKSREILARILEGVPEDGRRKIVCDNTARTYHFA